ncbi:hypothetical protein B0H10DRAFT_1963178 [Mycena sp. CBHHK59/15]|nr:hypothetical protein B0H10DRAFT_1963178 [Mycena sp. CBHHK59/15]
MACYLYELHQMLGYGPTPPKTPPPFRGCVACLPQTPCSPFKFDPDLSKAIPAGNFLIIRGVHVPGHKKIDPIQIVEVKIAEIRSSNPAIHNIPVDVVPFSTRNVLTSCYLHLATSLVLPNLKAEPHTDLLQLWIDALATTGWEVQWALQVEGKDKRMWLQTVNRFKSGRGIIVTFALPANVNKATTDRYITFDSHQLLVYRVRQIEIGYVFKLVIGGTSSIEPSTMNNIRGWFTSFEHNGETLLVETHVALGEKDYLIVSMKDWAATADVLKSTKHFHKQLADYDLCAPQLLFCLNTSAAWKTDPSAVMVEGAEKVSGAVAALTRCIKTNERDARTHDADMKGRLVVIDANVTSVTNVATALAHRQEELGRGFFLLQQENQLSASLGRIDTVIMITRQTFSRPIDDDQNESARVELLRLKEERKMTGGKLSALHGTNIGLIGNAGPSIPPPPPSTALPPLPSSEVPSTPWGIDTRTVRNMPNDTTTSPAKSPDQISHIHQAT